MDGYKKTGWVAKKRDGWLRKKGWMAKKKGLVAKKRDRWLRKRDGRLTWWRELAMAALLVRI
jgi:hypothetical protein